jgi:anti-anti-sigma factor
MRFRTRSDEPFKRSSTFLRLQYDCGVLVALVRGPRVGEREAMIVSSELNAAFARVQRRLRVLVLDLSEVAHLSSMGLGMCIDARHRAAEHRAVTVLYGASRELRDLLRTVKVERLYRVANTEEELRRAIAA